MGEIKPGGYCLLATLNSPRPSNLKPPGGVGGRRLGLLQRARGGRVCGEAHPTFEGHQSPSSACSSLRQISEVLRTPRGSCADTCKPTRLQDGDGSGVGVQTRGDR